MRASCIAFRKRFEKLNHGLTGGALRPNAVTASLEESAKVQGVVKCFAMCSTCACICPCSVLTKGRWHGSSRLGGDYQPPHSSVLLSVLTVTHHDLPVGTCHDAFMFVQWQKPREPERPNCGHSGNSGHSGHSGHRVFGLFCLRKLLMQFKKTIVASSATSNRMEGAGSC